ncbi:protease modulator HflC [Acidobacteria bacterium AH-259-D05]|nr:protease modulator HflC [Acidobacteria bacterium AH-259-D05]
MSKQTMSILLVLIVVVILIYSSAYTIDETQQVIITQFGRPVGEAIADPGIQFKIPFIQVANRFDKRFLEWDGDANQIPTKDKRFIWVDTYARWRITDPLKFFERLRDELGAQSRLDDILDGETRNAIAQHDLVEVVRSSNRDPDTILTDSEEETGILEEIQEGREAITEEILQTAQSRTEDLGIELIDFQLKRINYVAEVQQDVFMRMIAERNRVAERYRSEGEGEAARIGGERERELKRIQSEAYRTAQELQGEADAEATQIYAEAYNRDASFYAFMKSLETLENTADSSSTLILSTDADLLEYLKQTQ